MNISFKRAFLLCSSLALLFVASCSSDDSQTNTDKNPNDDETKLSCKEGFAKAYPNATNVDWNEDASGYNIVTFDLPTTSARSGDSEPGARAWYADSNINFLTQEYISIDDVPEKYVTMGIENHPDQRDNIRVVDAIKGYCKGNEFYKVLFHSEYNHIGMEPDEYKTCYVFCDGNLLDMWEYNGGGTLPKTEIPVFYAMSYLEANYDSYCLMSTPDLDMSDDLPDNEKGYAVPIFFTDRTASSGVIFVENNTENVRVLHNHTGPNHTSDEIPSSLPTDIKNKVTSHLTTAYPNENLSYDSAYEWIENDGITKSYMIGLTYNKEDSQGGGSINYIDLIIDNQGNLTEE